MKLLLHILTFVILFLVPVVSYSQIKTSVRQVDFYGDKIELPFDSSIEVALYTHLSAFAIESFYKSVDSGQYRPLVNILLNYKRQYQLDDWLYYQLVRVVAENLSPKLDNYQRYTLYKWFLLLKSGFATTVSIKGDSLLLYVQSDDEVFNIPCHFKEGKQYVCLNYHDYGAIDFKKEKFTSVNFSILEAEKKFSYKVNKLPDFNTESYAMKELHFDYYQTEYSFKILMNNQIKKIFNNYPVVDYETYFNIPLSKKTYTSLIPLLRKVIKNMNQKNGIDYLMHFTRNAFAYQTDTENFGAEKRLSPEQTLLYDHSDCEDRAALFFYLVKELYNLPMIVLSYPQHITIAVEFDKPLIHPITYNGINYWVCEPTPQKKDLRIGEGLPVLNKVPFDVVYAYRPEEHK